ncbi:hypothetical protein J2Z30_002727 [Streptomyces iranensis]|uniref:Secreted protein n=1 Tax=Streptomyces iranensis TaxID=576784 RepID=A0ABS4MPU1_9ACTN|nr:hypothetical protein [Streptomyces iranensis]
MGKHIRWLLESLLRRLLPGRGHHRAVGVVVSTLRQASPVATCNAAAAVQRPSLAAVWSPDADTLIFLRPFPDPNPVRPYVLAHERKRREAEW